MISSADFIRKYSKQKLNIIVDAICTWQTYAAGEEQLINDALLTISTNKKILQDVMNLTPDMRLYRGIGITHDDQLATIDIGEIFLFKQLKFAESWADYKTAYSFASSKEWHKNFGGKDIGLIIALRNPQEQNIILAPAHKTIGWFEDMIESRLPKKQKEDRKTENEYLVRANVVPAFIVKKIRLN